MRITVGDLRQLILWEMKLGVAGAEGDARAWGKKPLPDDPVVDAGDGTYIATEEPPNYEPDEAIKALYRKRGAWDMAGDEIDDELEDAYADAAVDKTVPSKRPGEMEPASMRATLPLVRRRAG